MPRQSTQIPFASRLRRLAVEVYRALEHDGVFNGAAALGFYLTLAIFPAMIVLMAMIPYLPLARVDDAILDLLRQALPPSAASMFADVIAQVASERRGGVLSIGLAATLWAASTGMHAIMQQMNIAYDVPEGRPFLRARATALGLTLLFAVFVLGAFSLIVLGGVIQDWFGSRLGFNDLLLGFFVVFRWVIILLALQIAFALIYYLAPNRRSRLVLVDAGSVTAVIVLIAASLALQFYVSRFAHYDATYGSIGAVIVLMLWLYMAGFAMLLGAEINAALERRRRGASRETSPVDA